MSSFKFYLLTLPCLSSYLFGGGKTLAYSNRKDNRKESNCKRGFRGFKVIYWINVVFVDYTYPSTFIHPIRS